MRSVNKLFFHMFVMASMIQLVTGSFLSYLFPEPQTWLFIIVSALVQGMVLTPLFYWKIVQPYIHMNEKLNQQMQSFDQMTNLGNHRNMYDQLKRLIAYNTRHHIFGAVLLVDLDKLGEINEQFGNEAVKKVFITTAKRLVGTLRKEDVVCHTRGSEFYVLLSRLTEDQGQSRDYVKLAAKRILKALKEPLYYKKQLLELRPYIGIQLVSPEATSIRRLLNDLDTAIYNAKRSEQEPIAFTEDNHAQFNRTYEQLPSSSSSQEPSNA